VTLEARAVMDGSIVCLLHVESRVQGFVCSAREVEVPGPQPWSCLSQEMSLPTHTFAGFVLNSCLSHAGELDGAKQ
jgi:hypothetical protein